MAARTERIRRKSRRAVNYTDLVPRLVTVDDFLEANERANARGKLLLVKWLPRATHGPLPRRAPSTRCTAESVHHMWRRFYSRRCRACLRIAAQYRRLALDYSDAIDCYECETSEAARPLYERLEVTSLRQSHP